MEYFDKMILIAGAGRNVGKTTLCCRIIEHLSKKADVIAVKLSSHVHEINQKQRIIFKSNDLVISKESDLFSGKDTSRYLNAGAKTSLFVQTTDEGIPEFIEWLKKSYQDWIVCESGEIGKYIIPRKAIFVDSKNAVKKSKWNFVFQTTFFENEQFDPGLGLLLEGVI